MIDKVHPITGIGINCTKPEYVESLMLKDIRTVTDKPGLLYIPILAKAMIVKLRLGMAIRIIPCRLRRCMAKSRS